MSKTVYEKILVDRETGEVTTAISIKKKVTDKEKFIQTYINDLGVLLKCTKGQTDFLITCILLGYVEFDSNELIINSARREEISKESGIKVNSIYNIINLLKKKNIIVSDGKRIFLNPKLFFYGSEIERQKMFTLSINYEICPEC